MNNLEKNAFNFLRLFCCLVVLYEHCVVLSGVNLPCFNLRGIAVNVFFILSGFWVTLSFCKSSSIKNYFFKRAKKILPQYWLVVILSAVLFFNFSSFSLKEYFCNSGFYKYLFANILTLNFIHPNLPGVFEGLALSGSVNGSLWTIKIELAFYIVLPLVILLARKLSFKDNGGGYNCIVLLVLYVFSVLYEVLMPFVTEKTFLPSALNNQFPAFLSYFVSGMAFALFGEKLFSLLKIAFVPSLVLVVVLKVFNIPVVSSFLMPISLTVCVMFLGTHLKIFNNIGRKTDFSYSIYLVHYPLAMCFIWCGLFSVKPIFAILSVLGVSFLCAYLLEMLQKKLFSKKVEVLCEQKSEAKK